MRLLTRHGQIIDNNLFRRPETAHQTKTRPTRAVDDFEVVYHSEAIGVAARDEIITVAAPHGDDCQIVFHADDLSVYYGEEPDTTPDNAGKIMATIEGDDLFLSTEADWQHVESTQHVPVSRFSPDDSVSPPTPKGILRSASTKIKSKITPQKKSARPHISAPLLDMEHSPRGPAGVPRALEVAQPIKTPAPELATRYQNVEQFRAAMKAGSRKAEQPPNAPTQRQIKVLGPNDTVTTFGDFISASDSSSVGSADDYDTYNQQREILQIYGLRPLRQPTKKVDTSRYSWMPPESPVLPRISSPASVTSSVLSEVANMSNIDRKIDNQIASMDISSEYKATAGREAPVSKAYWIDLSPGRLV